jgi:tRNA-modifying protein YgfZ
MSMIHLPDRGVVKVVGPDAATLLNGLVTNDVTKASQTQAIFAAMLTPQGKYLFDMFVLSDGADGYVLDVSRPSDFTKRLMMYKLRSKVSIEDMSQTLAVYALLDRQAPTADALFFQDPRMPGMGHRYIGPIGLGGKQSSYQVHRIELGVPDPSIDLLVDKDFIMEGLFDELHGLDFHKGCYVGQEMTSRMKRRTSVKNKLCRVRYEGDAPQFEAPILADGWEVGRMRTGIAGVGIAMIRFDRARKALATGQKLLAGDVSITLDPPAWLVEPAQADPN